MLTENYISCKISDLCKENNISAYKLSQITGISQSVLSGITKNNRMPTLITLERICTAFGITLAQFFAGDNTPMELSAEQKELLSLWAEMNYEEKRCVKAFMKILKSKE